MNLLFSVLRVNRALIKSNRNLHTQHTYESENTNKNTHTNRIKKMTGIKYQQCTHNKRAHTHTVRALETSTGHCKGQGLKLAMTRSLVCASCCVLESAAPCPFRVVLSQHQQASIHSLATIHWRWQVQGNLLVSSVHRTACVTGGLHTSTFVN